MYYIVFIATTLCGTTILSGVTTENKAYARTQRLPLVGCAVGKMVRGKLLRDIERADGALLDGDVMEQMQVRMPEVYRASVRRVEDLVRKPIDNTMLPAVTDVDTKKSDAIRLISGTSCVFSRYSMQDYIGPVPDAIFRTLVDMYDEEV